MPPHDHACGMAEHADRTRCGLGVLRSCSSVPDLAAVAIPSLLPGKAVTGFGVLLWLWLLAFTDSVWSVLPTWLRAVSAGGWAAVTLAACLQAFVLGISGHTTPARVRRHLWITFTTAGCVLVVVATATLVSDTSAVLQDPYVFTNSLMEGRDPGLLVSSVTSTAYVALILVQLIWTGARNVSRTPVGIGLGLLAAASAVELVVLVSGGIWAPLAHGEVWEGAVSGPGFHCSGVWSDRARDGGLSLSAGITASSGAAGCACAHTAA